MYCKFLRTSVWLQKSFDREVLQHGAACSAAASTKLFGRRTSEEICNSIRKAIRDALISIPSGAGGLRSCRFPYQLALLVTGSMTRNHSLGVVVEDEGHFGLLWMVIFGALVACKDLSRVSRTS